MPKPYIHIKSSAEKRKMLSEAKAKLTQPQVIAIRQEWEQRTLSQKQIAAKYGVVPSTISDVVNFRRFENW